MPTVLFEYCVVFSVDLLMVSTEELEVVHFTTHCPHNLRRCQPCVEDIE